MYETKAALALQEHVRRVRVTMSILLVLCWAWVVGSVIGLVVEVASGAHGVVEHWGATFPAWVMWAVSVPISAAVTVDTQANWRASGRQHGLLDYQTVAVGLRLLHPRRLGRARELVVRLGEQVEIHADLLYKRRGGLERAYRYTVTAPGGSLAFTRPVYIEKLTLAPLDEAARPLGIRVVTSGAADEIARSSVHA